MRLMDELGLLSHVLPEVDAMKGVPNFRAPVETDVFEHTLEVLGLLETPSFVLALGALLHDVGKPKAYTAGERPRFTRHEVIGEEVSRCVCERLRTSAEEREAVCRLVRKHMLLANARKMRLSRLRRLFAEERFLELAELFRADSVASLPAFAESDFSPMDEYEYAMAVYSSIPEEEIAPAPLIRGDDLIAMGLEPGPLFGELLEEVRDAQLEGALKSKEEGLAMVRRLLGEKGVCEGGGGN
jgi:poly(A) polymerase